MYVGIGVLVCIVQVVGVVEGVVFVLVVEEFVGVCFVVDCLLFFGSIGSG